MLVCGHGDVADYCEKHDLTICEQYDGDLENYNGRCRVVVTDAEMTMQEYCYLKLRMFKKGIEVHSIHHELSKEMMELLSYINEQDRVRRKESYGGRQPFGWTRRNGEVVEIPEMIAVARRIIELRDKGWTYREIQMDKKVRHPDGRIISVSTIQMICKNRSRYKM